MNFARPLPLRLVLQLLQTGPVELHVTFRRQILYSDVGEVVFALQNVDVAGIQSGRRQFLTLPGRLWQVSRWGGWALEWAAELRPVDLSSGARRR